MQVISVFAGLNTTLDTLAEVGLSRPDEGTFRIGKLSPDETESVVYESLSNESIGSIEAFRSEDKLRLGRLFARASEYWPRHLNYYVKGLLRGVHRDQIAKTKNHSVDIDAALEYGNIKGVGYYERVISSTDSNLDAMNRSVSEVLSNVDTVSHTELHTSAQQGGQLADESAFAEALKRCLPRCVIEPVDSDSYAIPIPSMKTYMQSGRSKQGTKELLTREIEQSEQYRDIKQIA